MRKLDIQAQSEEALMPQLEAYLVGVALTSPDVHGLVGFYMDAMGYEGTWCGETWRGTLGARWLEIREGAKNVLDYAAFAVADERHLASLRTRLGSAGVSFEEIAVAGLNGRSLRFADPDGNALVFGTPVATTSAVPSDAAVARLQHVVYASDQVAPLLDFYWHVLGFSPSDYVHDEAGDLTSVFLRCSEEHHNLAVFRASRKRLDHICFDVAEWAHIRDWADRFAERRITLCWGPGRHGPGNNLFLFVNDPDGNWLEFSAELEQVPGARVVKRWVHEERTLNSWGTAFMRS